MPNEVEDRNKLRGLPWMVALAQVRELKKNFKYQCYNVQYMKIMDSPHFLYIFIYCLDILYSVTKPAIMTKN